MSRFVDHRTMSGMSGIGRVPQFAEKTTAEYRDTCLAEPCQRDPQVVIQVSNLGSIAEIIEKRVADLTQRLEAVLTHSRPIACNTSTEKDNLVPLAERLSEIYNQLCRVDQQLTELRERIEC